MIAIALLLLAGAVGFGVARWRGLPAVPFLLLSGLLLNFLGLMPERAVLEDSLQLGLAFLVFAAGIELSPRRVGRQRIAAAQVGAVQFFALGLIAFGAISALGGTVEEAIYLALALAASSTLLVVRLLQQRKQMFEPFGRLVLGVLLMQDMLVILLLPILGGLPEGVPVALRGLAGTLVLLLGVYVSIRWVAPYFILELGLDEEGLLLVALATLFVFIGAALWLGLPMIAGAFLAGVALSGFPVNGIVRGQLGSLSDFFLAIFLTALGGFIAVPEWGDLLIALVMILIVVVLTPPLVTFIAERSGMSARASIESGLLLAQTSEFSLIVALQGWSAGHLREEVLTIVAIVTMVTMFLTPFIATNRMTWRLMSLHPIRRQSGIAQPWRDHILLLGAGDTGMPILETLLAAGNDVVVIDDDPAVIDALRDGDVPCIRGDGSDFQVLRMAAAEHARVIISTMRRPRDSVHLLDRISGVPTLVRVFDDVDAARIREHGGIPISYAEAAAEDFMAWLEQAESFGIERERRTRPRHRPEPTGTEEV